MASHGDVRLEFLLKEADASNKEHLSERVQKVMKSSEFAEVLKTANEHAKGELAKTQQSPVTAKLKGVDLSIAASANDTSGKPGGSVTVTLTFHF